MKEECGTAVLSIAHRLSTLQNCDEIIVMDKGCIVQRGTSRVVERARGFFRDWARGIRKYLNCGGGGLLPADPCAYATNVKK